MVTNIVNGHIVETPVKPFEPTPCLVLKQMRWQDRNVPHNYAPGKTILLNVTPANDWAFGHVFLPARFKYGEHFKEI